MRVHDCEFMVVPRLEASCRSVPTADTTPPTVRRASAQPAVARSMNRQRGRARPSRHRCSISVALNPRVPTPSALRMPMRETMSLSGCKGHRAAGRPSRPRVGCALPARLRRHDGRSSPGQRHLPRRHHRLSPPRGVPEVGGRVQHPRHGQPERHVCEPQSDRRRSPRPVATRCRSVSTASSS